MSGVIVTYGPDGPEIRFSDITVPETADEARWYAPDGFAIRDSDGVPAAMIYDLTQNDGVKVKRFVVHQDDGQQDLLIHLSSADDVEAVIAKARRPYHLIDLDDEVQVDYRTASPALTIYSYDPEDSQGHVRIMLNDYNAEQVNQVILVLNATLPLLYVRSILDVHEREGRHNHRISVPKGQDKLDRLFQSMVDAEMMTQEVVDNARLFEGWGLFDESASAADKYLGL